MARDLTAYGYQATKLIILPTGASALLIQPIPGQISSILKYFSGGSLEIIQAAPGTTGTLISAGVTSTPGVTTTITLGTGYLMSGGEAINTTGAARYYLAATGATTVAYLLMGLSQEF